ncbi:hypothetical protein [Pseudomonas juntendi]|uniref:hypothetical protein n=1 Tax=Pseudomonas juntendi TaxID=2666183 RepID=UPI0018E66E98|nr:hypothetical protein [Pseudomonas juntendi]MBI6915818.1 hypothetical protein [Pseudomonas juntendi]MDH0046311.1 hypothetical protein [Pseudomonas juntendi]
MLEQSLETKDIFYAISNFYPELNVSIRFISKQSFIKTPEENLLEAGIEFDSILRFKDQSIQSLEGNGYTMVNAGGFATNYVRNGTVGTAVFLGQEPAGVTEAEAPNIYWALQTILLHHELMHAKDLYLQKNFDSSDMSVNLVKAEIYADVATLRFFEKHKKSGGDTYRNLYAAGIVGREGTGIYKQIFKGITKSFPEAQLRAWASMSVIPPIK